MKVFAKILAVLALALAPAVTAQAQPWGRGGGRGEARREAPRGEARRFEAPRIERDRREPYRAPGYAAPPRAQAYPYPVPAPGPARPYGGGYLAQPYPPAQAYRGPPAYAAPPPGYAPNSLGADWAQQQDQARRGVRQGGLMPLRNVMSMIKNRTPGHLLDAGLEPGPDGRPAYRVRWAAQGGRRIDFIVDAATGAILRRNGY